MAQIKPKQFARFRSAEASHLSSSPSECCIFRIHEELRGVNEKAYDPDIVAIGPYHRGKDRLQMMEEHKLRYLQLLLERKNEADLERYVFAIRSLEQEAQPISLSPDEMIEMLILDGCFIIELVWNFEIACLRDRNDPIFKMDRIDNSLQRDLMLFENQLPFSILCELFDLIEIPNNHNRLIRLALCFFSDLLLDRGHSDHVLGNSHNNHLLGTESFFRNLIAYEQYCPDNRLNYVTDYVKFLDCLIETPQDVEILHRRGIINNWKGDDEVVARIFKKISDGVTGPGEHFQYPDVFNKVNRHCSTRRNQWMANLNQNYLNSPWAFISILAALLLLLLTLTQTIFTVFPIKH
ncbi:UPF0481 protein At3g47200-like [Camellia sinensis]|uniref:UPF0481 protein At3g47200-like n=1 Tax=Camellia sinensis TaxID=4442 RepID=UPI0010363ADD|nr:UPF0481 protein At3g47200-like [Camellia sinensis]